MAYRQMIALPLRFDKRTPLAMMRVCATSRDGQLRTLAEYALPQGQHALEGELVFVEFFDRRAARRV